MLVTFPSDCHTDSRPDDASGCLPPLPSKPHSAGCDLAMMPSSTSVIIPTRNRQPFVRELIQSILAGNHVPAEILVVDQSDDADPQLASIPTERDCAVVYLLSSSRGLSAARNDGIRTARYDVLVFVDDDVLVTPTWLATLLSTLAQVGHRAVVTGQVQPGAPEQPGAFAPSVKTDESTAVYRGRDAANVLWPNNMAMFRTAVDEVGFFDERLGPGTKRFPGGGEDNDFCYRLLEAGYRIVYEPGALVYHRAWRRKSDYIGLRWRYGRGQGGFYGKHLNLRDRYVLRLMAAHVVGCCAGVVRYARRDPRRAVGSAANGAGIVTAVVAWLLSERLLPTARRYRLRLPPTTRLNG